MNDLKVNAILWLQDRLAKAKNPYESRLFETALEYASATNSNRKVGKYYKEGLLRDARKKLKRERDQGYSFDNVASDYLLTSDYPSQEFKLQYLELETLLLDQVGCIHEKAKKITLMLREGFATKEIAMTIGLSETQIKRIVTSIKKVTKSICLN